MKRLEAPPGFEPGVEVLQTSALPLGDGADRMRMLQDGEHRIVPEAYGTIKDAPALRSPRARIGQGRLIDQSAGWYHQGSCERE